MPIARRYGFRCDLLPRLASHLEACDSFTYAIWDGETIKIGKSCSHPVQRLADLQVGNPRVLRLVAYSAVWTEQQAHRRLSAWKLRGEWHRVSPEELGFIGTWCWVDQAVMVQLLQYDGR